MAEITIPEPYESGLAIIVGLSDDSVRELVSTLQITPTKLFPYTLAHEIAHKVQSIPVEDLSEVIETLQSLYLTRVLHEVPADEMADDIAEAATENGLSERLRLSGLDREKFKQRLTTLLSIESLEILAKALGILRNNQNVFHEARIITEIRPVFGTNVEALPPAAVILHMLNITCHGTDGHKEFFIALDTDDIDVLRDVVDRAETKAESLKAMLNKAGTTYLETE
jgi:hypothetical protein